MAISLPFPDEGLHQGKEPGFVGSTSVATSISSDSTNEKGTFSRSGSASHYTPIASYEGAHRYDPDFQWEPKEEQRLVRRLDLKVCAFCCLTFFALQLDRGNITQAVSDNMITDLGMNTNDYNTGQTIFTVCFLLAELPSQLISKKLGAERWIPIQMVSWSLVASFQAFMRTKSSFFACRALLGMLEGGFIPDTVLYLSYFYTSKELPIRLSFFWTAYQFTSIISAFMAFGILHMRNINGMPGWAWLFALEGTLTGLIGVSAWFYLPASPCQTANRWRESWFTEREEKIIVNRVLRDDPSKGKTESLQPLFSRMLTQTHR